MNGDYTGLALGCRRPRYVYRCVLDKGERETGSASHFIQIFSVICVIALVSFSSLGSGTRASRSRPANVALPQSRGPVNVLMFVLGLCALRLHGE